MKIVGSAAAAAAASSPLITYSEEVHSVVELLDLT